MNCLNLRDCSLSFLPLCACTPPFICLQTGQQTHGFVFVLSNSRLLPKTLSWLFFPCHTETAGRQPLIEDDLWWKSTLDWRQPFMEGDHWWKTTFEGRQPFMEDDFCSKTIFDWRRSLIEEDCWWKKTVDGRKDWWKMTFERRQPLKNDNL